ncbi:MAG: protein translocase subunit SecD [Legionellaceae bacterium]|nr:protein translocase subunit SecD [Legionellaceae bacterium]
MFNTKGNKFVRSHGPINKTAAWKTALLVVVLIIGIIYAIPNLFGSDPAIQISSSTPGTMLSQSELRMFTNDLKADRIIYKKAELDGKHIVIRFVSPDTRLLAKDKLAKALGGKYIVAGNDVPATPAWLEALNARPMKLGLDLRGGMSLLLQVDIDDVIKRREQNSVRNVGEALQTAKINYTGMVPSGQGIVIDFANTAEASRALSILNNKVQDFTWQQTTRDKQPVVIGQLSQLALTQLRQYTMQQTINTLDRRVNELGVSESTVQQQGMDRVSVDLPGVSDATEAQDILGKTATIEAHAVDYKHDAQQAQASGVIPAGDVLLRDTAGQPVLLKSDVVLSGENITSATTNFDQTGEPIVQISVAGAGQPKLYQFTSENVGKPMAVVYTETKSSKHKDKHGKLQISYRKTSTVINQATINGVFSANFEVTGLTAGEAQQLALLLRAGALPAPIAVLSEMQVGPSMGKENVHRGMLSVQIGLLLVVVFMALYYSIFGLIADVGLVINLVLIVAIMSLLGGTLTFPGIAGIVLTVGMAVDANVLIFERIREELRNGTPIQLAMHAGYDRAIVTIVDAQLTTLIAAIVLFGIGTGPIKGFAVVLTIGLLTSMLTAINYTRAIANHLYGGKTLKKLPIGMRIKQVKKAG